MHLYHDESWRKMCHDVRSLSAAGAAELLHSEKSINALEYKRILQNCLLTTVEKLLSKEKRSDVIFQQGNAPDCTAQTTKNWLEIMCIRLMFWPGQSPDLNPKNIVSISVCSVSSCNHRRTG
uniref:Tc1-like transposase DDE domain-containing protein n=1 Tax=Sinocyclocheilus rhinocerous TaxID=307959 RepID=A0A673L1A8_9TELE